MPIARFTHVSEKEYLDAVKNLPGCMARDEIPLPKRSTPGSAGYDFVSPIEIEIPAGGKGIIPTGIRCEMQEGWVLMPGFTPTRSVTVLEVTEPKSLETTQ